MKKVVKLLVESLIETVVSMLLLLLIISTTHMVSITIINFMIISLAIYLLFIALNYAMEE